MQAVEASPSPLYVSTLASTLWAAVSLTGKKHTDLRSSPQPGNVSCFRGAQPTLVRLNFFFFFSLWVSDLGQHVPEKKAPLMSKCLLSQGTPAREWAEMGVGRRTDRRTDGRFITTVLISGS